jgi:hydrogenase maturation protease
VKKILILGIGNVLYADEGIGVHFVNYIKDKYQFNHLSHQIDLIDGGTLAQSLIPLICQYDQLIVVDTVNSSEAKAGDVFFFDFDHAPAEIDWQGSAHEVEMLQTLTMMDMVGDRPATQVLGVIPTVIEPMTLGLTPSLIAAIPVMEKTLLGFLDEFGITAVQQQTIKIEDVIPDAYKRGVSYEAPHSV